MTLKKALVEETRCSFSCWCKVVTYDIYTDSYLVIPEDLAFLKQDYLKNDFATPAFIIPKENIIEFSESD